MDTEDLKNYVTAIAIVLGVLGGAWKWFLEEWLRRLRDIPSLSGDIRTHVFPLSNAQALLQIDAEWMNNGNFAAHIDPDTFEVCIFEVAEEFKVGFLRGSRPGRRVARTFPRKGWGKFFFEPRTRSVVQTIAAVNRGHRYLIEVSFGLEEKKHGALEDRLWTYERRSVVDVPTQDVVPESIRAS